MKCSTPPLALALAGSLMACGPLAAEAAGSPDRISPRPRFERLSRQEGLSQNTVFAIEQDRQGFLWLGTKIGLNRYDGYGFRVYTHDSYDPASLADGFVRVLLEDRSGALWLGTSGGGLDRFDPVTGTFSHHRRDPEDPSSLAGDDVRAILEDSSGKIWVGTHRGGLQRFEPRSAGVPAQRRPTFVHYRHDPEDASSLPGDDVRAILEDRAGKLWIGTNGGGLARFDGGGFTRYRHQGDDPGSLVEDRVRVICEDHSGKLWIGTNGGLDRFEPSTGSFAHYRHDPGDPRSLSSDRVRSCHVDRSGRLWVGTRAGLDLFDGGGFRHHRHDPDDPASLSDDAVYSIREDRSGGLWIGTYKGGLNRFEPGAESFLHVRHDPRDPSGLGASQVTSLYEDSGRRLWVGTFGGGLDRVATDRVATDRVATDRLERSAGAASTGPGFAHYRHDARDPGSLASDRVRCLLEDRSGRLWVGTYDSGLSYLDPASGRFVHYRHDPEDPSSLSQDDVRCLAEDRAAHLWVGTYSGGLNRLDPARQTFTRFRHSPENPGSLSHDSVRAILEDRSGNLWVGTDGGLDRVAADRLRGAATFTHFRHDSEDPRSLSHDSISTLHEDPLGRLWIGTYGGGLNRLDRVATDRVATDRVATDRVPESALERPVFVHYTEDSGLGDNHVFGILEDRRGRLWISTNRGLARFDPAAERWTGYDVRDGLQDVEFGGGTFHHASGLMYFGGDRGFNAFRPERFEDNTEIPPVVVTSFQVFDRELALGRTSSYLEEVELGHDDNFFTFEFAALNYHRPDRNRYRHRLEGLEEDWVGPDTRRYASYTKVPPGDYVFRVQGSNNDGYWNEEGASIRIEILPPPWRTWWAYGLYLATLAALAAALRRSHRQKLERERESAEHERRVNRQLLKADRQKNELIGELEAKNAELERFTYTVSHDLKSPLLTVKGFLGLLRKDVAAGNEQRLEHDLERLEAAADKMTSLLDDLLQLSRVGRQVNTFLPAAMHELAAQAVSLLAAEIAGRGAEVEIMPGMPQVVGDSNRLVQVLQNLIHNAIKYMGAQPAPRVTVGVRSGDEDGEAIFFVRDNGLGIEPADRDKVFDLFQRLDKGGEGTGVGLALVKRIVEVHGGRIWVESEGRFQGSTFCFSLPNPAASTGRREP